MADTAIHGRRNLIINGAMQVAQRGTSFTGVTASGTYPVDRFLFHVGSLGTWTLSQSTDVPTGQGFAKSIKCDVTTADTSPTGTDYARIDHRFEGQDLQAFCKGTSNAKQFALSFYVKSPKTGTHIVELQDADNTRNISKAYTVSSANTWEKKELIIDADTTGAFDNDNAKSLTIAWWLSAGTDYKSGTLATTWGSPTDANRVVGQVNIADSTSNDFYLTGVQLEVGEQVTPFEFRSYGEELTLCQRYYTVIAKGNGAESTLGVGAAFKDVQAYGSITLPVEMRASPAIFHVNATNYFIFFNNNSSDQFNTVTLSQAGTRIVEFNTPQTLGLTVGHSGFFRTNNASSYLAVGAEL